jgi:hypothetical protein
MTSSLNGTGTHLYGDRERDIGGTYITTKWVVILWVPIIPLSSWRVYPMGEGQVDYIIGEASRTSQGFQANRVPLNWKQVLNVYAVAVPSVGLAWFALHRMFPGWL